MANFSMSPTLRRVALATLQHRHVHCLRLKLLGRLENGHLASVPMGVAKPLWGDRRAMITCNSKGVIRCKIEIKDPKGLVREILRTGKSFSCWYCRHSMPLPEWSSHCTMMVRPQTCWKCGTPCVLVQGFSSLQTLSGLPRTLTRSIPHPSQRPGASGLKTLTDIQSSDGMANSRTRTSAAHVATANGWCHVMSYMVGGSVPYALLVYVGLCWFVPAVLSQPLLVDVYCRLHRWVHVLPHHAIPSHAIPSHESTPRSDMIFVGLALAEPPQKQRRARFQHVVGHHHCAGQQHTQLLHDRKVLVAGAFPQVKRGETVQSRQQWLIPSP